VHDLLALTGDLPERSFVPGEVVVAEGAPGGEVWILVSGSLRVRKGDQVVNTLHRPGVTVGEISVLLGRPNGATVEAVEPSVLRHATDGEAFLADAAVVRCVAEGLAARLNLVSSYLADLRHQYGEAPGLSMVGAVLGQLSNLGDAPARPGSVRDPEPEY
jgi:CRP-like cAMP-binding protein